MLLIRMATPLFLSPTWLSIKIINCCKRVIKGVEVNIANSRGLIALSHVLVNLAKDQNMQVQNWQ